MMAAASYQIDPDLTQAWSSRLLLQAAKLGDTAAVETLLAEGANVNAATSEGNTPLMMAASFGKLAVLRLLTQRGAAINLRRSDGFSALTLAVFFGHEDLVRELLDLGADLNAPRSRGEMTPEMWATARGFPVIAELLKESRERIHPPTNSNITEAAPAAKPEGITTALSENSDSQDTRQEHSADAAEFFEFVQRVSQTDDSCVAPEITPTVRPTDVDEFLAAGQTQRTPNLSTAGHETANDDEFFEEGIRRVGQTKWTTEISNTGRLVEKEVGDKWTKKPAKSEKIAASRGLTGYDHSVERDGFSAEGIRRVGQTSSNTTRPSEATEYCPQVSAGAFSPLSTLSDRLGWRSKDFKHIGVLLVVLFAVGIITFVQQRQPESQPAAEVPAAAPEQASSTSSQPKNHDGPAAEDSMAAANEPVQPAVIEQAHAASTEQVQPIVTEQTPPVPVPSIVAKQSPDQGVTAASMPTPLVRESGPTVGNPDIAKSLTSNRRPKIASPPPSNPRQKRVTRTSKKVEPVEETSAPAAITIVPSEAPKRAASTPNVSQSQPGTLIEGSSNKKKVIQWP